MYRNSGESESDNLASLLGLSGGSQNYIGVTNQDMYLETSTPHSGTPTSSLATSPPTTPMTPDPLQFGYPSDFLSIQQEQHHQFFTVNSLLNSSINSNVGGSSVNNLGAVGTIPQSYMMQHQQQQQQQQYFSMLQQHNQLAQRKMCLANIAASGGNHHHNNQQHQQQDEISNSLKRYAMFSAYKDGIENNNGQIDVMQDFASNGYTTDDVYLQQHPTSPRSPLTTSPSNIQNMHFYNAAAVQRQQLLLKLQTQSWLNLNFPETQVLINIDQQQQLQNMWNNIALVPQSPNLLSPISNHSPLQTPVASNTSGGSSNLSSEANMSAISASGGSASSGGGGVSSGAGGTVSKGIKRQMKDKYASSKRCVFCENNNEPEAVTRSHSVRDALGRVLCPKLRTYICPICKASGDNAHTVKYCPKKPIVTMEDAIKAQTYRLAKSGYYNKKMKV